MSNETNDRGAPGRARVAGEEEYEVCYFAEKHGTRVEQARALMRGTATVATARYGGTNTGLTASSPQSWREQKMDAIISQEFVAGTGEERLFVACRNPKLASY